MALTRCSVASVQKHLSVETQEGVENSEKFGVRKGKNTGEWGLLIDRGWD